ncbi:F-box domain containing protein [Tanacetum coccineum]
MDRLPSNIILDIFSRVPVKYLACSRCVSKVWCKYIDDPYLVIIHDKRVVEPTPILYHSNLYHERICFHAIKSKQTGTTHYVLEPKEGPFLEYLRKEPLSRSSISNIQVRGSCNGVMCILQDVGYVITSLAVVHPLRKECYELPAFPLRFDWRMHRESCGLGFDTSTNTWKMVCVLLKEDAPPDTPDMVKKNLCTMVHVFGTNSWRDIPQVPSYPISGEAVFFNGCLHWLASYSDIKTEDGGRPVIWFDVEKEVFGLIDPPKRMCDLWRKYSCRSQVVDLNGEVGYVCTKTMEVWLLNHKKEWVPHCRFKEIVPYGYIDVIGCWNKDGDILIKSIGGHPVYVYVFYVYNLKSGVLYKTNLAGSVGCPGIFMYPNTLSSIHGINTNSFSVKTTDLMKSCQDLHHFVRE